ncbi:gap junction delta-2 protein [Latimeria chalumnae]|uniref:Uncharacterized protein n=1 Tax=Latimeria chalumnae TaxID=7897 RepID=H3AWH1_LATCH|nr:PREDICTED: gap junction delta-2 protein-like [Latimeria chalumnae]|eukprot:XP_005997054.1 PREDICTED: gap junction delta-2 protein-like [Latimeria chalumnae]
MGDWSILGRLLTEVQNHSTVIGKIWLTMLLIFRILLVTLVGDAIYSDEQSKFTCNTLQPGCNNVCYDTFAPVSHLRFWVFQIVLVSTPSIFYIIYILHKIAKDEKREVEKVYMQRLPTDQRLQEELGLSQRLDSFETQMVTSNGEDEQQILGNDIKDPTQLSDKVLIIYIVHVILRSVMEVVFLVGQFYLYGFEVPHLFRCQTYPCPTRTDCFVSRATEKTIFLNFMFGVSLGCFLLNIVELHYLGWVYVFRILCSTCSACCVSKRKKKEKMKIYSEHNPLLMQLKNSIQEKLVMKTSSKLSQEKLGYLPSNAAAISFATDSTQCSPKKSPDIKSKHGSATKAGKAKKSWL